MIRLVRLLPVILLTLLVSSFMRSANRGLTNEDIIHAQKIIGLTFTRQEMDSMRDDLSEQLKQYRDIRNFNLGNDIPPAFIFNPVPAGYEVNTVQQPITWKIPGDVNLPDNKNDLAFYSILELASLLRSGKISSVELTRFFIDRLKRYGDTLQCVITITEELAIQLAEKADREMAEGIVRGPLHGIPYGAKDLLAVEGYRTTWGAAPFREQMLPGTASVIQQLNEAGAVLIAKLTLGALAWGDVWYDGVTRNPWDLDQGSSGSSAGSASATAAGLVPFAIGSETWGSIVSPSTRCGVTGLRPSFGRVSRTGAMALSWTMDKLGPMCRSALDCAIVFESIIGKDPMDPSLITASYDFNMEEDPLTLKVGYFKDVFDANSFNAVNDRATLDFFESLGVELHPVSLPDDFPQEALSIILSAESAAAFDELTRSGLDSLMVRQIKNAWPNAFRKSRFIPAVEYINANRIRYQLIQDLNRILVDYDAILTPTFGGDQVLITNLTGHPCVVLPNGFNSKGQPTSFSIIGNLFDEGKILTLARLYQERTDFEDRHPSLFQ